MLTGRWNSSCTRCRWQYPQQLTLRCTPPKLLVARLNVYAAAAEAQHSFRHAMKFKTCAYRLRCCCVRGTARSTRSAQNSHTRGVLVRCDVCCYKV